MFHLAQGMSICKIAKILGRDKSTISRELKRNSAEYLPSKAQAAYHKRRKKCRPHKLLEQPDLFVLVKKLFLELHCSAMFDTPEQKRSTGNRGAIRKLRHNAGKSQSVTSCLNALQKLMNVLALVISRPIPFWASSLKQHCCKLSKLDDKEVETALIKLLAGHRLCSITPDRGREFRRHGNVTKALGVEFYFPKPRHPWERDTNENTNGLLRKCFPKGYEFNALSDEDLQKVVEQLNRRPRKCLGYRTPQEVYFSDMLHFT